MSTALYRRYRPETFADVIGQEHVTEPLMTALRKNRVNHAYLFSGPRGCGKTTSARILARCLNCAEGPTPTPCGTCESCQDLARNGAGSLDVIEMDAASHGGVDHARDLRERATFAPVRDRYKIFIIDEAHMVTREGFNALLKIVEEPPEHIKFIFATTEPNKVLGTIRSRTHHYPFRLVAPEVLRGYLQELCEKEGIPVEQGVLPLVVRAGGGSVRDSLSVLDQLMAGAGQEGITYDLAVALLGFTHAELLDGVVDAFAAGDAPAVFQAVDRVIQTGQDPRRFVEDLLERFRDLIIVKAVPDSAGSILHGMPEDQVERMRAQAQQLGSAELSRSADITNQALTEMTGATSPQLHLELLCARILLPTAEDSTRGVGARVDRLERRINMGSVGAVQAPLQQDPASVTTPETPAEHAAAQADGPAVPEPAPASGKEAALAQIRRAQEQREQEQRNQEQQDRIQQDRDQRDRSTQAPAAGSPSGAPGPSAARGGNEQPQGTGPQGDVQASTPAPSHEGPRNGQGQGRTPESPRQNAANGAQDRPAAEAPSYSAQPTAAPDAGQVNMIARSWDDVVAAVGKRSKVAQATFRECRPARFENGVLFVSSTGPGIQTRVQRYAAALSDALQETLGVSCSVALDGSDGPGGGSAGGAGTPGPTGQGPSGQNPSGGPSAQGRPTGQSPRGGQPSGPSPSGPSQSGSGTGRGDGSANGSAGGQDSRSQGSGPQSASTGAAAEDAPWPDEDQWAQAARQQERSQNPSADQRQDQARPSRQAASGDGWPALPSDGPTTDSQAWAAHAEPLQEEPAWSQDEDGEDFSGWTVAAIPQDEPADQPRVVPEDAERPAPAQSTAPAPDARQAEDHASESEQDQTVEVDHAQGQARSERQRPSSSQPTPPAEDPHPTTGSHLRVVRDDEAVTTVQTVGNADSDSTDEGAPARRHPAQRSASDQADPPAGSATSSASDEASGADAEASRTKPCQHDWSITARKAGAPGRPVDGEGSGWGYSGPDGSTELSSEHPARWGQRAPHLARIPSPEDAPAPSSSPSLPEAADEDRSGTAPEQETPRHLHAVPASDEEPGDLEYEESWAPEDTGYPTGPAVLEDEPTAESDAPAAGRALSFRERHAAEIARGASSRGARKNGTESASAEDDWENFVPAPDDEDVESSAAFGTAAVETILGGRVIEERHHSQQM